MHPGAILLAAMFVISAAFAAYVTIRDHIEERARTAHKGGDNG